MECAKRGKYFYRKRIRVDPATDYAMENARFPRNRKLERRVDSFYYLLRRPAKSRFLVAKEFSAIMRQLVGIAETPDRLAIRNNLNNLREQQT